MNASVAKPRSLRRDVGLMIALQGAGILISLATSMVVARALGPEGKGIVDYYLLLVYFVTEFGSLGIASGLVYMLTREGLRPAAGHGVGLAFSVILGATAGAAAYGYSVVAAPSFTLPAVLAAVAAPFAIYRVFWGNIVTSLGQAPLNYWASFVGTVLMGGLVLFLWRVGGIRPEAIMVLTLVTLVVPTLVVAVLFWRREGADWNPTAARRAWTHGRSIYPGHLANSLHFRADQYLIAHMLGPAALGIYALGARLAEMFWLLDQAVIAAALQRMTSLPASQSWALALKLVRAVAGVGAIALVIAGFVGADLIALLFGEAFRPAHAVLMPLLVGSVLWSCGRIFAQYLGFRLGKLWECTKVGIMGTVLNLAMLAALVYHGPLAQEAVAWVSMLSYGLTALVYFVLIRRIHKEGVLEQG